MICNEICGVKCLSNDTPSRCRRIPLARSPLCTPSTILRVSETQQSSAFKRWLSRSGLTNKDHQQEHGGAKNALLFEMQCETGADDSPDNKSNPDSVEEPLPGVSCSRDRVLGLRGDEPRDHPGKIGCVDTDTACTLKRSV